MQTRIRFQERFNQLPLEIKGQILFKTWNQENYIEIFLLTKKSCVYQTNSYFFLSNMVDLKRSHNL